MARQKQITETPKVANEDLEAKLYYGNEDPRELRFMLTIHLAEGGTTRGVNVKVTDHCDPSSQTMNQCLVALRDACLDAAGYLDV